MEAVAGAAVGASCVFEYNRGNYLYDRKMRQETEYQIVDFRIKQADLWREDVRDVIGLTIAKMDTYLIISTFALTFVVMAFLEGRLGVGTPPWIIHCHTLSIAGAFMYLLMSIWFSMHATVTARSYQVRMLTQHVRLPMPTWSHLEGARTYASSFEKVRSRQMFRVPFVSGSQGSVLESGGVAQPHWAELAQSRGAETPGATSTDPKSTTSPHKTADLWGLEAQGNAIYELSAKDGMDLTQLRHLRLVQRAMPYWQSYDGFARVTLNIGMSQFVTALAYYVLSYVLVANHAVFASWFAVVIFVYIMVQLVKLDMSLTPFEFQISVGLLSIGPGLSALALNDFMSYDELGASLEEENYFTFIKLLIVIVFSSHALWLMFLLYISKVSEQEGVLLPAGFRSVMYVDVFGWVKSQQKKIEKRRKGLFEAGATEVASRWGDSSDRGIYADPPSFRDQRDRKAVAMPAMEAVKHDQDNHPVPSRLEASLGAARSLESAAVTDEDLWPTTFVPCEDGLANAEDQNTVRLRHPGFIPWRIFCAGTILLISLWWIGFAMFMAEMFQWFDYFDVVPTLNNDIKVDLASWHGIHPTLYHKIEDVERLSTHWSQAGVHPRGLSCTSSQDGGTALIVASTRFHIFAAHLPLGAVEQGRSGRSADSKLVVNFTRLPKCHDLDGEYFEDVAVRCKSSDHDEIASAAQSCSVLVLHRRGQMISECSLAGSDSERSVSNLSLTSVGPVQARWLLAASKHDGTQREEIIRFTLGESACDRGKDCAFAQTNRQRIVELESRTLQDSDHAILRDQNFSGLFEKIVGKEPGWFPTRVIEQENHSDPNGGGLAVIGTTGRNLALLRSSQGIFKMINLQGHGGSQIGTGKKHGVVTTSNKSWKLPEHHRWISACSVGNHVYVLSDDVHSPQLWRFPLPLNPQKDPLGQVEVKTPALLQTASSITKALEDMGRHQVAKVRDRTTLGRHLRSAGT